MSTYQVPDEIIVTRDGAVVVVTLNRPDDLNATNHVLHQGLAELWPQIDADPTARAVLLTGAGRAFCAGGDFNYIDELSGDRVLRQESLTHGRMIVMGMMRSRVPIIAAVNGPAVGLGCSLVALSDIAFIAESAHLADPHVLVGLVAADGGPITWPLMTSLLLAKEYALTGDRIPAKRAAEMGLVNHVCPDDEVMTDAMACAQRIAKLPQAAVEDTRRVINLHLERAVLATIDYALLAENRSFESDDVRKTLDRVLRKNKAD
jgi:enoyl-CoA hydratase